MYRWLAMIYLAGHDDLEPAMTRTLLALEAAGPPEGVAVAVQLARAPHGLLGRLLPGRPLTGIDGDWWGVRRFSLRRRPRGSGARAFHSEMLGDLGPANMAHPATLAAFVTWAMGAFSAVRCLLAVAGHGMAFAGLILDLVAGPRPWLMGLPGLAAALRAAPRPLDVLVLDACMMNSPEAACQLALPRPAARCLVTPAWQAPADNLDYPALLGALAAVGDEPADKAAAQVAAALALGAGCPVLALNLAPERWRAVAAAARAEGAPGPAMLRALAATCLHPPGGLGAPFLIHWPGAPDFPLRYTGLYRRLAFSRLAGWSRLLPPAPTGGRTWAPAPVPGLLLVAWLLRLRSDLDAEGASALLRQVGWPCLQGPT